MQYKMVDAELFIGWKKSIFKSLFFRLAAHPLLNVKA